MKLSRRDTLVLGAVASAAGLLGLNSPVLAEDGQTYDVAKLMTLPEGITDHVLGPADAKVTVIEYASPTCPHCARFANDVYPAFKEKYIDTNKVRFILRPFVRNVLDAVIFLVAEAAGPEKYHDVVDTYFKTQDTWIVSDKPRDALEAVAIQLGFTKESFEAALTNQDLFTAMEKVREQASKDFGLSGTPTFYVNGKQMSGEKTLEELSAEIDPLLA